MRPARFAAAVLALALAAPALLAPAASAATIPDAWVRNDDIPFASVPVLLPTLFSNNTGGVMALGFEPVNGTTRLVSSFFTLATGWSPLTVANASNSAEVFAPHGALGDDGSAVAAWELDPIANTTVGAAVYRPGVGWSASTTLSTTLNAAGADAAMGSDGRAIVTWTENVSGTIARPSSRSAKDGRPP